MLSNTLKSRKRILKLQWQNHNKRRLNTNRKLITFEDYLIKRIGKCDYVQEDIQEVIHDVNVPYLTAPVQHTCRKTTDIESKVNRCRYTCKDLEFFYEKSPMSQKLDISVRKDRMRIYLYMNTLLKNTDYEGIKGVRQFINDHLRK